MEAGATESCSYNEFDDPEDCAPITSGTTKGILHNIISSINWMWHVSEDAASALEPTLFENGMVFAIYSPIDDKFVL